MTKTVLLGLMGAVLSAGCGEKSKPADPLPPPPVPSAQPAPAPSKAPAAAVTPAPAVPAPLPPAPGGSSPQPTAASAGNVNGLIRLDDFQEGQPVKLDNEEVIRRAIMVYVEGMQKPFPATVRELVDAGVLKTVPPAPDGKQWVIERKPFKIVAR